MNRSTLELRIVWAFVLGAAVAVLVVRWISRLTDFTQVLVDEDIDLSDDIRVLAKFKWYHCVTHDGRTEAGHCTNSWWDHWWHKVPYCKDVKRTCEFHGGKFKIIKN